MAITVDGATVARWTGTPAGASTIASASFTPPSGSLLLVAINGDSNVGASFNPTCSGGGHTWTERVTRKNSDGGATEGFASIFTAPVVTGASMTVSVGRSANDGGTHRVSAKCYIITGQHASPIGTSAEGTSATNNVSPSLAAAGAGRLFGAATDWNALGAPTSTDTEDAAHHASQISLLSAYKAADHVSGSQSINFDASGTSAADWNYVLQEILAAAGVGDTALTVADALHAHTADNLALIEQEVIAVADALHGHTADTVGLLQQNLLVVADATHGHTVDNLTLDLTLTLVVADATHGHLADEIGLIQQNLLAVADATHGHTADNLTLDTGVVLAVADALHAHGVDNVALTQAAILAVAEALHGHTADTIGLQQGHLLAVQDATHAHSADALTLTLSDVLAVADSIHVHTADTIELTQASVLIVSDALHAHLADLIALQLPGLVPPPGRIFDAKAKRTVFVVEGERTTFIVARGTRTFNA